MKIPAGLIDNSVEFFEYQNDARCIYNGQVYAFEDFPEYVTGKLLEDMEADTVALKSISEWPNLDDDGRRRQWVLCRFGGFDVEPDIDKHGNIEHTEYFEYGFRGACKHEGKICRSIKVADRFLTKTELEVLKRLELPDKLIADEMNICIETVSSHWQNIR